ncbi:MAG: malate synthase A, partial [Gemmatimonadaceae bacterium]|nr:malate synthase A [Gemmatimonadaceae bacterium]
MSSSHPEVMVAAPPVADADAILTAEALALVAALHHEFDDRRREVLARRTARRQALAAH